MNGSDEIVIKSGSIVEDCSQPPSVTITQSEDPNQQPEDRLNSSNGTNQATASVSQPVITSTATYENMDRGNWTEENGNSSAINPSGNGTDQTLQNPNSVKKTVTSSAVIVPVTDKRVWRPIAYVGLAALITIVPGYVQISAVNLTTPLFEAFVNASVRQLHGQSDINRLDLSYIWSCIVASFGLGFILGFLPAKSLSKKYGLRSLIFHMCPFLILVSSVFQSISVYAESFHLLLFGRLTLGFATGLARGLIGIYREELCPMESLVHADSLIRALESIGVFSGLLIGLSDLLGTTDRLPILLSVPALLGIFGPFAYCICPESPAHLVLRNQDYKNGKASLMTLGLSEVEAEEEMDALEADDKESEPELSIRQAWPERFYRTVFMLLLVIGIASSSGGQEILWSYGLEVLRTSGLTVESSEIFLVVAGMLHVISILVIRPLVPTYLGSRTSLFGSLGLMLFAQLTLCLLPWIVRPQSGALYLAGLAVCVLVIGHGLGAANVPDAILEDLGLSPIKDASIHVYAAAKWNCSILTILCFYPSLLAVGTLSFLPYIVLNGSCLAVLGLTMPERKGKSTEKLNDDWMRHMLPPTDWLVSVMDDGAKVRRNDNPRATSS